MSLAAGEKSFPRRWSRPKSYAITLGARQNIACDCCLTGAVRPARLAPSATLGRGTVPSLCPEAPAHELLAALSTRLTARRISRVRCVRRSVMATNRPLRPTAGGGLNLAGGGVSCALLPTAPKLQVDVPMPARPLWRRWRPRVWASGLATRPAASWSRTSASCLTPEPPDPDRACRSTRLHAQDGLQRNAQSRERYKKCIRAYAFQWRGCGDCSVPSAA